jgi:hypothetical protein
MWLYDDHAAIAATAPAEMLRTALVPLAIAAPFRRAAE